MTKLSSKEIADSVFERYPEVDKVFVASDGQAFFDETHAKNHAAKNSKRPELKVEPFLREEKEKSETKTAKNLIAEINSLESIQEIAAILATEEAGENRKSVKDAAGKRIETLKKESE